MSRARSVQVPTQPQPIAAPATNIAGPSDTLELKIEQIAAIWSGGLIESTSARAQHELAAAIDNAERAIANVAEAARRLEADADRLRHAHALVCATSARFGAWIKRWRDRLGLHASQPAPDIAPLITL